MSEWLSVSAVNWRPVQDMPCSCYILTYHWSTYKLLYSVNSTPAIKFLFWLAQEERRKTAFWWCKQRSNATHLASVFKRSVNQCHRLWCASARVFCRSCVTREASLDAKVGGSVACCDLFLGNMFLAEPEMGGMRKRKRKKESDRKLHLGDTFD